MLSSRPSEWQDLVRNVFFSLTLGFAALAVLPGCSGNTEPLPSSDAPTATSANSPAATSGGSESVAGNGSGGGGKMSGTANSGGARRRDEIWVDEKGQKWFGNVPMDVFFDNAYEVASDQAPLGRPTSVATNSGAAEAPDAAAVVAVTSPSATEPAMDSAAVESTAEPVASGDGDSWNALISLATLDEEIKSIRNFMTENVQSVGTFNSSMLMIPPKAATLGALAGIAMEHPEAVSWKEDAKYVRDLAKKMNSAPLQRGAKDQKRIQELFEAVTDTLNRSKPAGLEEPPESDSFAEVAEMRLLMMRMEDAEKKLKTEAGSESAMGSKKEMIAHEASMLSVIAKIVSMPGYGYGDDEKFTGYANAVLTGAQAAKEAAESGDFAAYESALTTISTSCSNCHSDFKND